MLPDPLRSCLLLITLPFFDDDDDDDDDSDDQSCRSITLLFGKGVWE